MIVFTWYAVLAIAAFMFGPLLVGVGWATSLIWRRVRLIELFCLSAYFGLAIAWMCFWFRN